MIDDSPEVRARIVRELDDAGLEVIGEAGDADGALDLARAFGPDAIVLDLQLGLRSGVDILPALKALVPMPFIVILTNKVGEHYQRQCLSLGADRFFDKSSEFDLVARTLLAARPA